MTNKLTIVLEIHDHESQLLKQLMDTFVNNEVVQGVKVYAAAHDDLFDKMERIEEVVEMMYMDAEDKVYDIENIINEGDDL